MKKRAVILIGIIILSINFVSCSGKKINEIIDVDYNNISKIVFADGRGRNKPFTLDDKDKIKEFNDYLCSFSLRKVGNPHIVGWIHSVSLYNNDDIKVMQITFVDPLNINNEYYRIIEGEINVQKIDEFIKSVNSAWEVP